MTRSCSTEVRYSKVHVDITTQNISSMDIITLQKEILKSTFLLTFLQREVLV